MREDLVDGLVSVDVESLVDDATDNDRLTPTTTILPALPPRPATPNTSYTVSFDSNPTSTIAPDTVYFGSNIDVEGGLPGSYFNPSWGSPLISAHYTTVNSNFYLAQLNNGGTIWSSSTVYPALAVAADYLKNTGTIVSELTPPDLGLGYTHYGTARGALIFAGGLTLKTDV